LPPGITASAAVSGPQGTVYLIGAANRTALESYDTRTNTWTSRASKPREQLGGAIASGSDGTIYAAAGATSRLNDVVSLEVYNPGKNAWSYRAPIPTVRYLPAAASGPDGRVYVAGGYYEGAMLDDVEAYDPRKNTWQIEPSMPTARSELAAVTGPDGKLYAIGGTGANAMALNTVEVYTP
jgi:N-acetylneuraminic acid mutarotase